MTQQLFLITSCDILREGLGRILSNEGFAVSSGYDDMRGLPSGPDDEGAIFLIDDPVADNYLTTVDNLMSQHIAPVIIILATSFDLHLMLECFRAGARGFIMKSRKSAPMIAAIKLAASGERVLPSDILTIFENQTRPMPSIPDMANDADEANLSPREHDVLCCLMAGFSNKIIARELDVCEATVKVHVKSILRKLNVNNRTQAAIWGSSHNSGTAFLPWQSSRYCPTAMVG